MAFWNKWFGSTEKKKAIPEPPSSTPTVRTQEPVEAQPRAADEPREAPSAGWFSREEILALRQGQEEASLLASLARKMPQTSREEVLFRYHLSRRVRLAEFDLPVFPQSAAEVLALGRNPNSEISEYVRVIGSDPALVRAVIDTAHSSFFASLAESRTLDQAIVRIGLRQVEQIVMVHAMSSRVLKVQGFDKLVRTIVEHSQRVAIASQAVARNLGAPPGDAFLGGIFHDIGKLLLLGIVAQVQKKLSWQAPAALVMDTFSAFHILVGRLACESWELPPEICLAVSHHHSRQQAAGSPLDRSVWLANLLAHTLVDASEEESTQPQNDWLIEETGLGEDELSVLIEVVEREFQAYEALEVH